MVSAAGYGVYLKKLRRDELSASADGSFFRGGSLVTFRTIFSPYHGGWIVDINRGKGGEVFRATPFPSPLAAMVALEIELANGL